MCLILSGSPREATTPLAEAKRLDPAEPRTPYLNVLGIAHYVAGDYSNAARVFEENISDGGPRGPHMAAFRASTLAELGREQEAQELIDGLARSYPDFLVERWLSKWHGAGEGLSESTERLYQLGLPRVH